jgi:hypothetical protein
MLLSREEFINALEIPLTHPSYIHFVDGEKKRKIEDYALAAAIRRALSDKFGWEYKKISQRLLHLEASVHEGFMLKCGAYVHNIHGYDRGLVIPDGCSFTVD